MSYSSLTDKYIPANSANYSKGRSGKKVLKITPHHMAGNLSVETCGKLWQTAGRKASSNYGIGTDGRIACYVDEENRAWTSSSATNDNQAITVEIANDGGAPDWHVSDKAVDAFVALAIDICQRYGISSVNYTGNANGNLTEHRYFASTQCPGPYLHGKMAELAQRINAGIGSGSGSNSGSGSSNTTTDDFFPAKGYWKSSATNSGGDKAEQIAAMANFMLKIFPSYTPKAAKGNYFGPNLRKAIKEFQRRVSIESDGNVGPITYGKLRNYGFSEWRKWL